MTYKHRERPEQIAFVSWFKLQYPELVIAHFANGGKRSVREGVHFKNMGTLAGMPDLLIASPSDKYHGLFIEMKPPKPHQGATSHVQKHVIGKLNKAGYHAVVAFGCDHAIEITREYLGSD